MFSSENILKNIDQERNGPPPLSHLRTRTRETGNGSWEQRRFWPIWQSNNILVFPSVLNTFLHPPSSHHRGTEDARPALQLLTMVASSWHLNMLRRGLGPPAEQSLTPSFSSCSGSRSSKPSPPPQLHPQSVPGVWTHKPRASPADCLGRLRKLSLWKLSSC